MRQLEGATGNVGSDAGDQGGTVEIWSGVEVFRPADGREPVLTLKQVKQLGLSATVASMEEAAAEWSLIALGYES